MSYPNIELDVFVCNWLHVKANSRNSRNRLVQFELIKDGYTMSSSVFWDRPLTAHQDDIRYSLVLPAASRPSMRIRISLLPKSLASAFDILAPMMFELLTLWMSEGRRGKEKRQRVEKKGWTLLVPTTTRLVALLPLSVALQQPTFFFFTARTIRETWPWSLDYDMCI